MAIHKHKLTTGIDHLSGGKGSDLYLAPAIMKDGKLSATLSNTDVINGGGGSDTIRAALMGNVLHPSLANIEQAVFRRQSSQAVKLDLDKAGALEHLTLDRFHSDAHIVNASGVGYLTISNTHGKTIDIAGINSSTASKVQLNVAEESLDFVKANAVVVDFDVAGTAFAAMDVKLSQSSVTLEGDAIAASLSIHSIGKSQNSFIFNGDNNVELHELYLSGKADLTLVNSKGGSYFGLTVFDAIQMTGDLKARIAGLDLTSVTGSLGNDDITVVNVGGNSLDKAVMELRTGNDRLDISALTFIASSMEFDGGDGKDSLRITGLAANFSSAVTNFETLTVINAVGTYELSSDFETVFLKGTSTVGIVDFTGGTSLVHLVGSSSDDDLHLAALGGAVGAKAIVELGNGADTIDVTDITLDFTKQVFYGESRTAAGDDQDRVTVSGNVSHIASLFHSFEFMTIFAGSGQYDFAGSDFDTIWIGQVPATAMSLVDVAADSLVDIAVNVTSIFTIDVQNAVSSHSENLNVYFAGTTTVGTQSFGLFATSLSSLTLANSAGASMLFLSTLGSASDFATLEINGSKLFTLNASNGADLFIDNVVITNTAGVDLSGLVDGDTCFAATGVTIIGGSGNDVLVGGNGADTISTGAGVNTVYGSLGIDTFDFLPSSGTNTIVYTAQNQSAAGSADDVNNFSIFQTIDVSALVGVGTFGGSVANLTAGLATLSTGHVVAFYDESLQILNIDLDHDGTININHDIQVHLEGLSTFNSVSLIF